MRKTDKTEAKIKEEISRIEAEIAEKTIQLKTLRGLIEAESKEDVPTGFKLAPAARKVFERSVGLWMSLDDVLNGISEDWKGYRPPRRSLQITLADWCRMGKLKKDETRTGFYMMESKG